VVPRPDEPQLKRWDAKFHASKEPAGGVSFESHEAALLACAAESLERHLWTEASDFPARAVYASTADLRTRTAIISPARFAGFSEAQRATEPALFFDDQTVFAWVRGHSLVHDNPIYIPAQAVSGSRSVRVHSGAMEPLIRPRVTTGLATWPQRTGAQLRGVLEIIERDAYMILWLNQLTLPRLDLSPLMQQSAPLARMVSVCERYMLRIHAIRMLTDAPTNAVCAIVEDLSGVAPRFTLGLRAGRSLVDTIIAATTEALRARHGARVYAESRGHQWDDSRKVAEIDHHGRLHFWTDPAHANRLQFLISGDEVAPVASPWSEDTEAVHMTRLLDWCRIAGYECASVSLGTNGSNPLPWHVESVVIPELQPIHLTESLRAIGGTRLHCIPKRFGYAPQTPFVDAPHPFI
jgi:ribosomal protein S12 methylthiotransferase accessory factor